MTDKRNCLTLTPFEADHSSLCVAATYGVLAGVISYFLSGLMPVTWTVYLTAVCLGWWFPWFICENAFKSAHDYYGSNSLKHRLYDLTGIGLSVLSCWFLSSR